MHCLAARAPLFAMPFSWSLTQQAQSVQKGVHATFKECWSAGMKGLNELVGLKSPFPKDLQTASNAQECFNKCCEEQKNQGVVC